MISMLPLWGIVGLAMCVIVLVAVGGMSIFMFLVKAGVIIHEAQKPPHMDSGDYRLDQGREVRAEGTQIRTSENTKQ